ncbi:MAG: AmmeMemoRadiSam system protein B [Candidatus Rokubacteria bacterium]|nr:AmmeMemoRadiSam system protein B [Candidatus Rokubacteria bacterium]
MERVVREPTVAGTFYPADPKALEGELAQLLPVRPAAPARAVVVPHAGWMYSGAVAGETYAQVAVPRLAVLLGPNHTGLGVPGAVMREGAWRYPGGSVPIARDLAAALLAAASELQEDTRAHVREHALEVQLPFLHRRQPGLEMVPITLGRSDSGFCRAVGEAVGRVVAGWPEPVLVVDSTDLNHYESQAVSQRKDRLAINAVLALDAEGLGRAVRTHDISMCGIAPTQALLWAAPALGIRSARLVRYQTSGDVSGDLARVVGYAGIILE